MAACSVRDQSFGQLGRAFRPLVDTRTAAVEGDRYVRQNTVNDNAEYGIAVFGSNNTIQRNTALGNGEYDAYDGGTATIWLNNTFGTTSPAGLG